MFMGPMTFIVYLALGVAVLIGLWLIVRAMGDSQATARPCPRCRNKNRASAQYCAHCGESLSSGNASRRT